MAGFLTRFYSDLRDDYEIHGSDSFLMQYLRRERQREPGKKPGGAAGRLAAAYEQASDGAGRRAYLQEALSVLEKSNKPLLRREPGPEPEPRRLPAQPAKNGLLAYAKSTGCPALARAARWDKKACRALLEHLGTHEAPPPDAALIEALHAELQDSLLRREAEDYLYNAQNGRKQNRDMLILEAYLDRHYNRYAVADAGNGKNSGNGEDPGHFGYGEDGGYGAGNSCSAGSALEVYHTRGSAGARQRVWTGEALEKCQHFFEALQKREHRYIWMPVEIDPRTGAGMYFIGTGYLLQVHIGRKHSSDYCRIACLYQQEPDPHLDDEDQNALLPMWTGTREELEELFDYPNVKEGLTWHRRLLEAVDGQSPLGEFQTANGSPPPECPPEFLCYFTAPAAEAPADADAARQEGRSSFAQENLPLQKRRQG